MIVEATFNIRRYWLKPETPRSVLDTLNYRTGSQNGLIRRYVDINYYGETDRLITMMELRYAEWILDREMITYTVSGDDGL